MQGQELYSGDEHFSASIAEVDRLPSNEEEAAQHRQLCGITFSYAKHFVRVSIHSSLGTISHSIPRKFPNKEIYLEIGIADGVATNHEIQLDDI